MSEHDHRRPQVTVRDAGVFAAGDLLEAGNDADPRPPWRWVALGLAVLLAVVGGRAWYQDRQERRAEQAAYAVADRVHLSVAFDSVGGFEQTLTASVSVTDLGERRYIDRVTGLRVEGLAVSEQTFAQSEARTGRQVAAGTLTTNATLDCGRVQRQGVPARVSLRATIVPASEVAHEVVVPMPPQQLREAVYQACDLPDPQARPLVESGVAASGAIEVYVEEVPRRRRPLVVRAVTTPGFTFSTTLPLPYTLPSGGVVFDLTARVTDCAAARRGPLELHVTLTDDIGSRVLVAGPQITQPQPDSTPPIDLLRRLVDEACPDGGG